MKRKQYVVRGYSPRINDFCWYSPSHRWRTLVFAAHLARKFGSRSEAKRMHVYANAEHGDLRFEVVEVLP